MSQACVDHIVTKKTRKDLAGWLAWLALEQWSVRAQRSCGVAAELRSGGTVARHQSSLRAAARPLAVAARELLAALAAARAQHGARLHEHAPAAPACCAEHGRRRSMAAACHARLPARDAAVLRPCMLRVAPAAGATCVVSCLGSMLPACMRTRDLLDYLSDRILLVLV